jgi:hypothetical protein
MGHEVCLVMVRAGAPSTPGLGAKAWIPAFAGMTKSVPPKSRCLGGLVLARPSTIWDVDAELMTT